MPQHSASTEPRHSLHSMLQVYLQDQWHCREERSSSTEGQIKFLVYTLEIASQRADASGEMLCCKGSCCSLCRRGCFMSRRRPTVDSSPVCFASWSATS